MADFQGIIVIHKEKGFTSHDVVAKLRGILHMKKIGHTGTLDPDAEGVLPVALGKATRLVDMITDKEKTYEAVMRLGVVTDTQDMSGTVLSQTTELSVTEEELCTVVSSFVGDYMQVPPMYSALKVNGKKLYELAREGKTVERKPRPVHFYEIEILDISFPLVRFRVTCSKGTYIRTLCNDIGEKLGCGGCMEKLLRTKGFSGNYPHPGSYNLTTMYREGYRVLLTLLQFFATKFLFLALHLESGCFPRPLTAREEAAAFSALHAGDAAAREKLIRHNLRLVAHIVKKYYALPGDQEDLVSIGTIGLMKAVDTFDATRKARFSTYASRCIENEIRMQFRRERKSGQTVSLQEALEADGDSALTLADVIQDGFCMEDSCERQEDVRRLRQLLDTLPARERQILLLRYGLAGQPPLTQLETAQLLQISRSYVSRLETHALDQLRKGWLQESPGE